MKHRNNGKRMIALILTLVMACTALSGCGKGGDSGKKASSDGGYDLVFWTYSDMVLNDQGKLMDQWVKEFVEENDDVNSITVVAKDDADLLTSLMAGVGLPDMFCARTL